MSKIFGSAKFKSPVSQKLTNPLVNGDKVKRLKKQHTEILKKQVGMDKPRSPF